MAARRLMGADTPPVAAPRCVRERTRVRASTEELEALTAVLNGVTPSPPLPSPPRLTRAR